MSSLSLLFFLLPPFSVAATAFIQQERPLLPFFSTSVEYAKHMPSISLYFVRHGQRIDQVDRTWARSSPCPQDPPLTNLGKNQARQTGKIIRDFALESSSNPALFSSQSSSFSTAWSVQRITPPESPDLEGTSNSVQQQQKLMSKTTCRPHHFAIVTSPFLRCSQTAIEMAIGIRAADTSVASATTNTAASSALTSSSRSNSSTMSGPVQIQADQAGGRDLVTVAVESGLAGKDSKKGLSLLCIAL